MGVFDDYMTQGKQAGDIDTSGGYGEDCSRGVDCSGFVTRVWNSTFRFVTGNVSLVTTQLDSISHLTLGDILTFHHGVSDSHMVMFDGVDGNGLWVFESTTYAGADRVVWWYQDWPRFASYVPRRYNDACQAPAPMLVRPFADAKSVGVSPVLDWYPVPGAVGYRVQLSTDQGFANLIVDLPLSDRVSAVQVKDLRRSTDYYWRVGSLDVVGHSGSVHDDRGRSRRVAWSNRQRFTTICCSPPVLVGPADRATAVSDTPTLTWQPVFGAAAYRLEVSTTPGFEYPRRVDVNAPTNSSSPVSWTLRPPLPRSRLHYWKVAALDQAGQATWSEPRTFTTECCAPPSLLLPLANATSVNRSPTLQWGAVAGAGVYRDRKAHV